MDQGTQPPLLVDVAAGLAARLAATRATDLAQGPLRRATPEDAKRREARVSPGPSSSQVAARKIAGRLGRPLDEPWLAPVAKAVHYAVGMPSGPVYWRPLGAGLVAEAALSLVVNEGLTPALGLSAPNRAYPAATHARGFVAHLSGAQPPRWPPRWPAASPARRPAVPARPSPERCCSPPANQTCRRPPS